MQHSEHTAQNQQTTNSLTQLLNGQKKKTTVNPALTFCWPGFVSAAVMELDCLPTLILAKWDNLLIGRALGVGFSCLPLMRWSSGMSRRKLAGFTRKGSTLRAGAGGGMYSSRVTSSVLLRLMSMHHQNRAELLTCPRYGRFFAHNGMPGPCHFTCIRGGTLRS